MFIYLYLNYTVQVFKKPLQVFKKICNDEFEYRFLCSYIFKG